MCYCKVRHNPNSNIKRPKFSFCFIKYKTHIQAFYECCIFYCDLFVLYYYITYFILFYTKQSALDYICLKIRHYLQKNKDFHNLKKFKIRDFRNMTPLLLAICQQPFGGAVILHFQVSLLA
jgi:hypothetical protein